MSALTLSEAPPQPVPAYRAEQVSDLAQFLARAERLDRGHNLPFHDRHWLSAWYDTLGRCDGREPLLVAVRLHDAGPDAALLPLVRSRRAGLWVVEFADAEVVDYIAPILADDWHQGADPAAAADALWRALRRALHGHDLLKLDKLLGHMLDGSPPGPNPLALVLPLADSELFGNQFSAPDGWETWRRSLDKTVRKEIERCWRVFERSPEARFEQVTDVAAALALYEVLASQQAERARQLGQPYRLDEPAYQAFYRSLIRDGVPAGTVVMTALRDGDAVLSAMLSVTNRTRMVALRQSIIGEGWKHVSPGRLLDDGTARHLHAQGLTQFDFGIGDYHHKAVLKMQQIPLYTTCVALSWRGWPLVAAWHARRWLKARPALRQFWLQRLKPLVARRRGAH